MSDTNSELINAYRQVRDHPKKLVELLQTYENSETAYYKVRESRPTVALARAARLLYLARFSFNGIHRVNLRGEFNVPYGHKTHLSTCDPDRIFDVSRALQDAELEVADFEAATRCARRGSVVYFDPPYTVAHENNGFIKYNERIFSWDDQKRLAKHAKKLSDRGCLVFVSNADHDSVRDLYRTFEPVRLVRPSRIAASTEHRGKVHELLFISTGA